MREEELVHRRYELLSEIFDERMRRLWAAAEAMALGHGGATLVQRATGISRVTVAAGKRELSGEEPPSLRQGRIRKPGGGRKNILERDATVLRDLETLVEPVTRGDPESPLRWTCKSVRRLAGELKRRGHRVSHQTVAQLLRGLGYSLQANRKTLEGASHPDRDAQFQYINDQVQKQMASGNPAISVDTKKKELVGEFLNRGREWRPQGEPEKVRIHDFSKHRVNPYGVYDIANNVAWVSVGVDHDTATFAVEAIRRWWYSMGRSLFRKARRLLITADGGGSNGSRLRLWKVELQRLADELGLLIQVCHLPPGTSKWNKIEHRLFSYITQNWRGKPLVSHEVIVNLIRATRTRTGLSVRCELDENLYPAGRKVSDKELAQVNLRPDEFHGEWNYRIFPTGVQPK